MTEPSSQQLEELSEYERTRAVNIERNNARLVELGLLTVAEAQGLIGAAETLEVAHSTVYSRLGAYAFTTLQGVRAVSVLEPFSQIELCETVLTSTEQGGVFVSKLVKEAHLAQFQLKSSSRIREST